MKILFARVASFCAAVCLVTLTATSGRAQIWNFDAGAEGWQVYDSAGSGNYTNVGTFPVVWVAAGGNPGGFINGVDPSGGSFMFQAPISNADYTGFIGGQLTFSLQTNQSVDFTDDSIVLFRSSSSGTTIVAPLSPLPGASWTNISINLDPASFRFNNLSGGPVSASSFFDVFFDLDVVLINGEYHNGISETTGLDSVRFIRPAGGPGAVPEPSTYGLIGGAALLGAIALRRRRK